MVSVCSKSEKEWELTNYWHQNRHYCCCCVTVFCYPV